MSLPSGEFREAWICRHVRPVQDIPRVRLVVASLASTMDNTHSVLPRHPDARDSGRCGEDDWMV